MLRAVISRERDGAWEMRSHLPFPPTPHGLTLSPCEMHSVINEPFGRYLLLCTLDFQRP